MVGKLEWVCRDQWPVAEVWGVWPGYFESPVKDLRQVGERPAVIQGDLWEYGCSLFSEVSQTS